MTRSADSRSTCFVHDLLAVASLWVLVLAFFWRIALAGRVLAGGDVLTYFYPHWAEATRAIRAGRLPLWNPYLFLGAPFLANSQAGILYPLNWPLWLLLPAHQSVHASIVLHVCLAALSAYLWGRTSLRLSRAGAWTAAVVFALGGYLGAQVEHVNQLQALAWLPLMLMLYDRSLSRDPRTSISNLYPLIGLALVIALIFLAGHTQTAFISLVGLAAYALAPALWYGWRQRECRPVARLLARRAAYLAAATGLGIMLAAVQLVPTWELSRLSVRAGGLPFNERVSFSLSPLYLARAFLPGFAEPVSPDHIEHVAYVGITALLLATLALRHSHAPTLTTLPSVIPSEARNLFRNPHSPLMLLALGLFLSLGLYNPFYLFLARFVPGFAHFRVPARWLALAVIGLAALAGQGIEELYRGRWQARPRHLAVVLAAAAILLVWAAAGTYVEARGHTHAPTALGWAAGATLALGLLLAARRVPRLATASLLLLLLVELWAASSTLPHSRATAPQAFTSLRPAIAHLLAAAEKTEGPAPRFISLSDITFDPGDLAEIEVIYGPQLSADALYELIVAAKHKEVLSPNLPLAFGIPAVDGYDGGVLPLARYVMLQRLFLAEDEVSMDGRLRENMTAVPDGRWLSLFHTRYVITDKLHDAWLDGVFYDLEWGARLDRGEMAAVAQVPRFEATALGIVSYLQGASGLPDGKPVGVVEVAFAGEMTRTFQLRAGEHTAEGLHGPQVAHARAQVGGHFWSAQPEGNDYVTRHRWEEPAAPTTVVVRATLPQGELIVRGVSLIDERTGGFQPLVLSDRGRFRLVHSGDVKIYENLDVLERAFLVHQAANPGDDEAALELMRTRTFDPATEAVLDESVEGDAPGTGAVSVTGDAPGTGAVSVTGDAPETGAASITGDTPGTGAASMGGDAPGTGAASVKELAGDTSLQAHSAEFARVTYYAAERVEIQVATDTPAYLILADTWYPGWEATVDGEPVPVRRADLLLRAVALPGGVHRVVFTFRPLSVRIGAGLSLVGLVGLAVAALAALRSRCPKRNAML